MNMKIEQPNFLKGIEKDLSDEKKKACVFTGHRELEENFDKKTLLKLIEEQMKNGIEVFYCGMAKGFDLVAGETVVKLKKKYPNTKLVACIPYYGQERGFTEKDKKRYVSLLKKCDEKVFITKTYYKGCLLVRNRYMVDRSGVLIAYYKKDTGGTAYTVKYGLKKGLTVIYV